MKNLRLSLAIIVVLAGATLTLAACGGDGGDGGPATPSPQVTGAPGMSTPASDATPSPTGIPFEGGQDPVQGTLGFDTPDPIAQPALVRVETAAHAEFDRIVFEFTGAGTPSYTVQYVTTPSDCGSGEPTFPAGDFAYIEVKFMPAVAHDEQGQSTFPTQQISANLPSIIEAKQSCDFEADLTWALRLTERVDFRVFALVNPLRLAVDVGPP